MTSAELAAVVAAALALLPPSETEPEAPAAWRWNSAGRLRLDDVDRVRLLPRDSSRWTMSGRLRD